MPPHRIRRATPDDAGEILTVQRAAFVTEAQVYGDPHIEPLTQTLPDLRAELSRPDVHAFAALSDSGRLIGAVRLVVDGTDRTVGHIRRLVVAPDMQGTGAATALMRHLHEHVPAGVELLQLWTGGRSDGNIRLYARLGYEEYARGQAGPTLPTVLMRRRVDDRPERSST